MTVGLSAAKLNGTESLAEECFKTPSRELSILPFWFWNGELTREEMAWQMRQVREKGIPGLFIHGRFGLKIPYLSGKWFNRVKQAVRLGSELGLDIWVYDEMNWPSGTAGRQLPQRYPHLVQKYLELVVLHVDGPLFTFLEATDSRYVNTGDSTPIASFACPAEELETGIRTIIDLTPNLSFDKVIPWEAPAGQWKLLYFLEKEVPYYIDALDPEATQRFLELTHERYKRAVGKQFGTVVPGFYTDEPAMHYYLVGMDNWVVPWTKQMFKIFRQKRGYDLRPWLPALFFDVGERTAQIRYDFWRTLSEQYSASYYQQIREWCDGNGVLFTGHLLFEEWLRMHARCEGNLFEHLKHMHIIGVDHLYPKIGSDKEPDQHVALKIGSSAAHHFGSQRVLCESMGGTYWDCTLARMKWIANWEYVLGVNLFNNHGYHYSIEGERKRDWPPSQFYHHPWWAHYDQFTTYMARLSYMLTDGRHVAKILVLYPLASIWANYVPQQRDKVGSLIEAEFNFLTDALLRLHQDFDYVDEDVLAKAQVANGLLKIGKEEYALLMLPPVTHLKRSTFEVLSAFAKSGGAIVADALLPIAYVDVAPQMAAKDMKELFGVDPRSLLEDYLAGRANGLKVLSGPQGRNVHFTKGSGLHAKKAKQTLARIITGSVRPDVTISDEEVFYLHRQKGEDDLYFFVNTTTVAKEGVQISLEKTGVPQLWDPSTGDTRKLVPYQNKEGRLRFKLDLAPAEAVFVVVERAMEEPRLTETNLRVESFDGRTIVGYAGREKSISALVAVGGRTKRLVAKARRPLPDIVLDREFVFETAHDNVLPLTRFQMTYLHRGQSEREYHEPDWDDSAWFTVRPCAWQLQLPEEPTDLRYPVVVWYRTFFEVEQMPSRLSLLVDGFAGKSYKLFLNGERVRCKGRRSTLDAEMKEVDISRHAREGRNCVAIRMLVDKKTGGILDPLKILGDFALAGDDGGYRIVQKKGIMRVGDWTKQGYPFYSGTCVYRTELELAKPYLSGKLFLEVDCGDDVFEVRVNGGNWHVRPWHPYRVDLTGRLKEGANLLELRVTNTLINALEGVQRQSGLLSAPKLRHYHRYELSVTD